MEIVTSFQETHGCESSLFCKITRPIYSVSFNSSTKNTNTPEESRGNTISLFNVYVGILFLRLMFSSGFSGFSSFILSTEVIEVLRDWWQDGPVSFLSNHIQNETLFLYVLCIKIIFPNHVFLCSLSNILR